MNGKVRKLTIPSAKVREVHAIVLPYLNLIPLSEEAHGFVLGRSIYTNALPHKNALVVLNFDIKSFFPSVTLQRFRKRCGEEISSSLPKGFDEWVYATCFWDGVLPQGSSCSPVLSNLFLKDFDRVFVTFCNTYSLTYTRYADDITVSYNREVEVSPADIRNTISELLSDYGLKLNYKKTLVRPYHQSQKVTGLSVNGDSIRIPRRKREEFYLSLKDREYSSLTPSELGYLAFVKSIDERFYDKIWKILKHSLEPN